MSQVHEYNSIPYVLIYTDGSCQNNPGPGGWAATLRRMESGVETKIRCISGWSAATTNNRMEMEAALQALQRIRSNAGGRRIILRSDSKILINGMNIWLPGWKENGWKQSSRKDVANKDLWLQLVEVSQGKNIHWEWVKGHSGDRYNEEVDKLAASALRKGMAA